MSFVLDEILRLTGDKKSLVFWKLAIEKLGQNSVLEEVRETKYQTQIGNCKNPARYLTSLLSAKLKNFVESGETIYPAKGDKNPYLDSKHLFEIQERLKLPVLKQKNAQKINKYISKQIIPWAYLIGKIKRRAIK